MTLEEARLTLQENFGLLSFQYPGRITEALKVAIEALSQPSLPSGLDEAANKFGFKETHERLREGEITRKNEGMFRWQIEKAFKAGAEWMAGKYEKIEGELVDWYSTSDGKDYCCGVKTIDSFEAPEGFYIRKKQ